MQMHSSCPADAPDASPADLPRAVIPTATPVVRATPHARIVSIIEKRAFDFTAIDHTLSASREVFVNLCPVVSVLDAYRVRLAVRVHEITITSGQSLRILVDGTMPSEEDPSRDFINPAGPFLVLDLTIGTQAPSLRTVTATDPDAYLRVLLRASQTTSPLALRAVLSIDLVLRSF